MLVCNVSLRPLRAGITAEIAEATTAADATATGNIVFAMLVDDPASVGDIVDAYLGAIMLEAASAAEALDAGLIYVVGIDEPIAAIDTWLQGNSGIILETATAIDTPDATGGTTVIGDPYWSNVKLLMGFDGANGSTGAPGMTDESSAAHGLAGAIGAGATISTAQSVFGGSSLALTGSVGGYIGYADSDDWHFSNQPFTVEFRMRANSLVFSFLVAQWGVSLGWVIYLNTNKISVNFSTTGGDNLADLTGPTTILANTWYAVCLDFDGTKYRLYQDGVMVASSTTVRNLFNAGAILAIGSASDGGSYNHPGYIDELRITKGTARYASDSGYTVATSAFPRSS